MAACLNGNRAIRSITISGIRSLSNQVDSNFKVSFTFINCFKSTCLMLLLLYRFIFTNKSIHYGVLGLGQYFVYIGLFSSMLYGGCL